MAALIQGIAPFSQTEFDALRDKQEQNQYADDVHEPKLVKAQPTRSQLDVDRPD